MSDLETTQSKLRSTPTAGVSGEHSAYYRRLLSAGYKGYIQGSIGGASLYGLMGAAVGVAVAVPAFFFIGPAAFLAIPAMGGFGVMHGASTFADIGKTAAIIAESADTNEKRRYLLDRYYETPSDEEAKAIKDLLENQLKPQQPEQMFHWKTVLVGAALGAALAVGFVMLAHAAPTLALGGEFLHIVTAIGGHALPVMLGIGTSLGAVAGGLIGLDREYVRRWLDGAENIVNDPSRAQREIAAREREVNTLSEAINKGTFKDSAAANLEDSSPAIPVARKPQQPDSDEVTFLAEESESRPAPSPHAIAGAKENPNPQVTSAQLESRLADMQQMMARQNA